jgi:phage baseplate assembly protein W
MATEPTYRDFDFSFKSHPLSGDLVTVTDEAAIRNSLKNLVRLNLYDKAFNPGITSPLYSILFEPVDQVSAVTLLVGLELLLRNEEPRITNVIVNVIPNEEENKYEVTVEYTVRKTQSRESVQLFLPIERLR